MKVKTLVCIERIKKREVEELKKMTGKSVSKLIEEGIDCVIAKYKIKPKTLDEALDRTYGIGKELKIVNVREKLNNEYKGKVRKISKVLGGNKW